MSLRSPTGRGQDANRPMKINTSTHAKPKTGSCRQKLCLVKTKHWWSQISKHFNCFQSSVGCILSKAVVETDLYQTKIKLIPPIDECKITKASANFYSTSTQNKLVTIAKSNKLFANITYSQDPIKHNTSHIIFYSKKLRDCWWL